MYKRTLCIALSLAACTALLSGCEQDAETDTILDNKANYSIDIALPYATITPEPNIVEQEQALVIDENGNVTVNDSDTVLDKKPVTSDSDESNYKTLSLGSTGFAVTALQTRLAELGYLTEDVTSVFDEPTEAAVRRFEQTYGTMQTGVATASVQARLFSSEAPEYGSEAYNNAVVSQYTILQRGDVGSAVYALQQRLSNLNYPISEISGVFDDATANAVMLFYEAYGYKADDTANVAMQKELYSDAALAYQGRVEGEDSNIEMGDSEISDLQNRLIELGFMNGSASGTYDSATQIAIKLFADACGEPVTDTLTGSLHTMLYSEDAPTFASYASKYSNMIEGASGEAVSDMQARLIELGFAAGTPNGSYGTATSDSLKLFQRYNGLEETGVATTYVQAVLYSPFALNIDGEAIDAPTPEQTASPDPET